MKEIFFSEDPCAIAMILMLRSPKVEKTRPDMPGFFLIPSPTTATNDKSFSRTIWSTSLFLFHTQIPISKLQSLYYYS